MKKIIIAIASIILIFNILLLVQNSKLKKGYITTYNKNTELEFNIEKQKNYIINNIQHPNLTFKNVYEEIKQYHPNDTAWVLLIPEGVCMACVSSLFSEITNLSINTNSFYLISEISFEKLKRERYSHKFKFYTVAKTNSIFQHFNSNIYIAKLIQHNKHIEIFMYDSDLYEFLSYFITDKRDT